MENIVYTQTGILSLVDGLFECRYISFCRAGANGDELLLLFIKNRCGGIVYELRKLPKVVNSVKMDAFMRLFILLSWVKLELRSVLIPFFGGRNPLACR